MQSYQGLTDAYHILKDKAKVVHCIREAQDIRKRVAHKENEDEMFELMNNLKLAQNLVSTDVDEAIKRFDELISEFETAPKLVAQQRT